jgi:hypothetical protein
MCYQTNKNGNSGEVVPFVIQRGGEETKHQEQQLGQPVLSEIKYCTSPNIRRNAMFGDSTSSVLGKHNLQL